MCIKSFSRYILGTETVFMANVGFIISKDRSWRSDFDWTIDQLKASGIIQKLIRDHDPNVLRAKQAAKNTRMADKDLSIGFNHVKSSLGMLLCGLGLASMAFAAETLFRKQRKLLP